MKRSGRKKHPKRVLRLPDLDFAKRAVLNTLGSPVSKLAYEFAIDDFVTWYCSEPRLAFSRTVVLRYRLELEARRLAPATINLRLAAVRRLADFHRTVYQSAISDVNRQNAPFGNLALPRGLLIPLKPDSCRNTWPFALGPSAPREMKSRSSEDVFSTWFLLVDSKTAQSACPPAAFREVVIEALGGSRHHRPRRQLTNGRPLAEKPRKSAG